jgi:hypothetical protein
LTAALSYSASGNMPTGKLARSSLSIAPDLR